MRYDDDERELSLRQFLFESMILRGIPWQYAHEAIASTAIEYPQIDWDTKRTLREWLDREVEL